MTSVRHDSPIYSLFCLGKMPMLWWATLAATSWQCNNAATQTVLKATRGKAFHASCGGTRLFHWVPLALQLPRRRRDTDNHGDLLWRETCWCRREHINMSREPKGVKLRLLDTPAPLYPLPHGLKLTKLYMPTSQLPTSHSSWWDHAALLTIMTLQTMSPLAKVVIQWKRGKEKFPSRGLGGVCCICRNCHRLWFADQCRAPQQMHLPLISSCLLM